MGRPRIRKIKKAELSEEVKTLDDLDIYYGRPSSGRSDPQKNLFLNAFEECEADQAHTCKQTNIPIEKLNRWLESDSEFLNEYSMVERLVVEKYQDILKKQAKGELKGNVLACIAFLNARGRALGYGQSRNQTAKEIIRNNTKDAVEKFHEIFKIDKSKARKISAVEKIKRSLDGTEETIRTVKVNE